MNAFMTNALRRKRLLSCVRDCAVHTSALSKLPFCDIVVLNSVNNIEKARDYIAAHNKANCFLDNDAAGEKCYQRVREILSGKEAIDMSDLYGAKKDLNEFLQASRGYTSEMKLTPHL